jgi:hypothetical protein
MKIIYFLKNFSTATEKFICLFMSILYIIFVKYFISTFYWEKLQTHNLFAPEEKISDFCNPDIVLKNTWDQKNLHLKVGKLN